MFTDLILGTFLGVTLNFFVHSLLDSINFDKPYNEKMEQKIVITLVIGVISMIIGYILWDNSVMRNGLLLGGFLLIFYSLVINWNKLDNMAKTILFGLMLVYIIFHYF
jgi:hypothetical protein